MKFVSYSVGFLTPTVYRMCPHPGGCKKCILWCSHIVLKFVLDSDQENSAKNKLMNFMSDSEGQFTPTVYRMCPHPGGCKKCIM